MKAGIYCVAVLMGAMGMGIAGDVAAESNSSPAPLTVPALLTQAQATGAGSTVQQPDYILNVCQETEHTIDPRSAFRGVDPSGWLANYIQNRDRREVSLAAVTVTLLEGTRHGKIFAEVDNIGVTSYHYDPDAGYLGDDKAVFMAEFEGKRYKIVVELKVLEIVDYNSPQCDSPRLIKVNGKPASGLIGH